MYEARCSFILDCNVMSQPPTIDQDKVPVQTDNNWRNIVLFCHKNDDGDWWWCELKLWILNPYILQPSPSLPLYNIIQLIIHLKLKQLS